MDDEHPVAVAGSWAGYCQCTRRSYTTDLRLFARGHRVPIAVATRFTDVELALIDELIAQGVGDSRSAVIRRGVLQLADTVRRAGVGATIAASYRKHPQAPDDDDLAMASALALTEAEPW